MIKIKRLNESHEFCRAFYKEIAQDFPKDFLKSLWTHKAMNTWEVHGDKDFYWYGRADCSYHAKAKALETLLKD